MPWRVGKEGGKYVVRKRGGGKALGSHESQDEADAQVRALYAAEGKQGGRRSRLKRKQGGRDGKSGTRDADRLG